jgi:hypothetical protein
LIHDGFRILAHSNAGESQDDRAGDRKLVLPGLVTPPLPHGEVKRTVDLDHHALSVFPIPLGVEVSPPSVGIGPNCLPHR